ncbi:Hypothetical protein VCSRO141_3607 [Vibrio cholerae]|nr:Hypothetical protein VCSRO141_3607 [Vibrio cholerae]
MIYGSPCINIWHRLLFTPNPAVELIFSDHIITNNKCMFPSEIVFENNNFVSLNFKDLLWNPAFFVYPFAIYPICPITFRIRLFYKLKYFTFLDSYRILWSIKIFFYHLVLHSFLTLHSHNARLRGWQRIPLNSNATTVTATAHWDWKRHALTVPLEAFVMCNFSRNFQPTELA